MLDRTATWIIRFNSMLIALFKIAVKKLLINAIILSINKRH